MLPDGKSFSSSLFFVIITSDIGVLRKTRDDSKSKSRLWLFSNF